MLCIKKGIKQLNDDNVFHIVLVEPEIPPNTGSIARLCGATNTVLHLVRPLGFSTDDKHLKRAGLDYWKFVDIRYWDSFDAFLEAQDETKLYFLTTKTKKSYSEANFQPGDYLVFGCTETCWGGRNDCALMAKSPGCLAPPGWIIHLQAGSNGPQLSGQTFPCS